MDMFDDAFQYLKTVSPEMMISHNGYLKRFILTKPKKRIPDVASNIDAILQKHDFKGKSSVTEKYGYIQVIYCFEPGLTDPELLNYFEEGNVELKQCQK